MRVFPALFLAVLSVPAFGADPLPKPARLGLCAACHGENGVATIADAPHLAGQKESYLRQAIAAYRNGARDVAVMRAAVGSLGEADIAALAHWYATRPPVADGAP